MIITSQTKIGVFLLNQLDIQLYNLFLPKTIDKIKILIQSQSQEIIGPTLLRH